MLDLVPVDFLAWVFKMTGLGAEHGDPLYYHRILPTADLNVPMGMSLGVLLLMFYYGIKIKHPGGFVKELFTAPFHAPGIAGLFLAPFNFLLNRSEEHTSELQSLMRISYAVFCLKNKKQQQ